MTPVTRTLAPFGLAIASLVLIADQASKYWILVPFDLPARRNEIGRAHV